jgi:hypothetical protein
VLRLLIESLGVSTAAVAVRNRPHFENYEPSSCACLLSRLAFQQRPLPFANDDSLAKAHVEGVEDTFCQT